jgi:hypothetical protein
VVLQKCGKAKISLLYCSDMKILAATTFDELVLIWLRRDRGWLREGYDAKLIDNPDLASQEENQKRYDLLNTTRGLITRELPGDVTPKWVLIEESDLPDLFIVAADTWYQDTGGSYRLVGTAQNMGPDKGNNFERVAAQSACMQDYDSVTTNEIIILVAPDPAGPFTIIDGNHRAIYLYLCSDGKPSMPWKGILIEDPRIAQYKWFINSPQAQSYIRTRVEANRPRG